MIFLEFSIYQEGFLSENDDYNFLKFFSEYSHEKRGIEFTYSNKNFEELKSLLPEKYFTMENFENEFHFQKELMFWVCRSLNQEENEDIIPVRPLNGATILQETFTNRVSSNCQMYAVLLNELFLSFNFKSRMITCLPMDLRFSDCHCVTLVFSSIYNKWIVFDPAMCTFYTNEKKEPLNISEMRKMLIEQKQIYLPFIPRKRSRHLLSYLVKNFVRFNCYQCSEYNIDDSAKDKIIYCLNPRCFPLTDKIIQKNDHIVKIIHTSNEEEFWK